MSQKHYYTDEKNAQIVIALLIMFIDTLMCDINFEKL